MESKAAPGVETDLSQIVFLASTGFLAPKEKTNRAQHGITKLFAVGLGREVLHPGPWGTAGSANSPGGHPQDPRDSPVPAITAQIHVAMESPFE